MEDNEYRIVVKQGNKEFEIGNDVEVYLIDGDENECTVITGSILHNTNNTFLSILTKSGDEKSIPSWLIRHINKDYSTKHIKMKSFVNKMRKIIDSKEFYKDTKEYFDEMYYENDKDETEAYYDTREYLYNKYFKKFEEEYYLLDKIEDDFYDFITELYENTINNVQDEFLKNIID